MKNFQLKVSIVGIPRVYRVIEASENCTFADLHEAIFHAFDRYDQHLYSFFITRTDSKNMRTIMDAPEITDPMNLEDVAGLGSKKKYSGPKTKIGSVHLEEKDVFHYWFDFGDDWWHRIRVEKIVESNNTGKQKRIELVKSIGPSPPQYPDPEEYDEVEE